MAFISDTYSSLRDACAARGVTLVAVSKTRPPEDILEAYNQGQRDFGENYVQELLLKQKQLPADIRWHFIGHLQRNKVKLLAPFVHLIHGVDTGKLLHEIEKQAAAHQRTLSCLLQVHIARESTKFGLDEDELRHLVRQQLTQNAPEPLRHCRVLGLMGMASFTEDTALVRLEFQRLQQLHASLQSDRSDCFQPDILSMGMSGDYPLAWDCGSNMIRVGSLIFGERMNRAT